MNKGVFSLNQTFLIIQVCKSLPIPTYFRSQKRTRALQDDTLMYESAENDGNAFLLSLVMMITLSIESAEKEGCASTGKIGKTHLYISCFAVDVLCILGTRSSSSILKRTSHLPFDESHVVPAIGQSGGINLLWNSKSVNLQVISSHDRFVHCSLTDIKMNKSCMFTFVYAYPIKNKQMALWNELAMLSSASNICWVLMGDFNIIVSPEEKLGGNGGVTNYVINFCNFLNNNGLVSLVATGLPFTWTNKHVDH